MPKYIASQRWYAGKGAPIRSARLGDTGDLRLSSNVIYADGFIWAVQTVEDPTTLHADIRWLEISPDAKAPKVVNEGLLPLARHLNLPLVCTNDRCRRAGARLGEHAVQD